MRPVPRRVELIGLGDKSQTSGGVACLPALRLLGVAQAHCYQAVTSNLASQPALQTIGWAASQTASALLSEVQGERLSLTESRLHFQYHQSCHEVLENLVCMSPRSSWLPPSSWFGTSLSGSWVC